MEWRLLHCSEQERNADFWVIEQVLTRGFARTSEFKWRANRQVWHSHPTTRQALSVADGDRATTDYIWGVIDMVPETNFPDIRNRCNIHSESGSCMVIPREGDKVRLYIQLCDKQVVDPTTGRVDKSRVSADHLLQVKILSHIFHPSRATQLRFPGSEEGYQTLHDCRPRDRLVDDLHQYVTLYHAFIIGSF